MSDAKLVYSTDPKLNERCPKCRELRPACTCEKALPGKTYKFVVAIRVEKQGRGGKTVTVLAGLPKLELFLKDYCTRLKKKCGAGGTYRTDGRDGVIELQGDRREIVRTFFADENIKTKG